VNFPRRLALQKKKLDDCWRLDVVEIARFALHASFQPSAHKQTPLSNDTIDAVLRHWDVGRAKDLLALPRSSTEINNQLEFYMKQEL
jgi:hypothetical protein